MNISTNKGEIKMKKKFESNIGKIFTVLTVLSFMVIFGQVIVGAGIIFLSL
jgi:hypothetical protein